jgi:hypothetical protein
MWYVGHRRALRPARLARVEGGAEGVRAVRPFLLSHLRVRYSRHPEEAIMYESWKWLVCAMLLGIATGTTIATVFGGGLGAISTTKGAVRGSRR